jgi:hypothetical protein
VGGSAIITSGIWASKVSHRFQDTSGHGFFLVTTLQEKHNKKLSLVSAYIAVEKGTGFGLESLHAQQVTIYERHCQKTRSVPRKDFCPRVHTIKRLDKLIESLQKQQHAIILMLDANQTHQECVTKSLIKPHTRRGMDDPFLQLISSCPNSTTYGILAQAILMLTIDTPAVSDHLGIVIDFDLEAYFSTTFSALATFPTQTLSSGISKRVDAYLNYVHDQLDYHKIWQRTMDLFAITKGNPEDLTLIFTNRY